MSSQPPSNGKAVTAESPSAKLTTQTYCDATLWLLDYDDEDKIQIASQGQFACSLIAHKIIPICITFCRVGLFHWPITTDAPVIRIGWRSFLFAVPGLLYGLQLPLSCSEVMLDDLISFFRVHSEYEDHKETATATAFPVAEIDEKFWVEARLPYESYLHRKLSEFGHYPGRSSTAIQWGLPSTYTLTLLSKATHALAMSFMRGVLQCSHIKIYNLKLYKNGTAVKRASPRISVYTSISNAMELPSVLPNEIYAMLRHDETKSAEDLGFELWILNEDSLSDLMKSLFAIVHKYLDAAYRNSIEQNIEEEEEDDDDENDDDDSDDDDGDGDGGGDANGHDSDDDDSPGAAMIWRYYE